MNIGSKVIYVGGHFDESNRNAYLSMGYILPNKDTIYTVRDIYECNKGDIRIRLEEIVNPKANTKMGFQEAGYNILAFREIDNLSDYTSDELINELEKELVKV